MSRYRLKLREPLSGRYISRVGRASRFLSLLPLDASVHQMPFYLKLYLNLLTTKSQHKSPPIRMEDDFYPVFP